MARRLARASAASSSNTVSNNVSAEKLATLKLIQQKVQHLTDELNWPFSFFITVLLLARFTSSLIYNEATQNWLKTFAMDISAEYAKWWMSPAIEQHVLWMSGIIQKIPNNVLQLIDDFSQLSSNSNSLSLIDQKSVRNFTEVITELKDSAYSKSQITLILLVELLERTTRDKAAAIYEILTSIAGVREIIEQLVCNTSYIASINSLMDRVFDTGENIYNSAAPQDLIAVEFIKAQIAAAEKNQLV